MSRRFHVVSKVVIVKKKSNKSFLFYFVFYFSGKIMCVRLTVDLLNMLYVFLGFHLYAISIFQK